MTRSKVAVAVMAAAVSLLPGLRTVDWRRLGSCVRCDPPAIRMADLTLDRAFSYAIAVPSPQPSPSQGYSCTTQFPNDRGAAITEVSGLPNFNADLFPTAIRVRMSVNAQVRRVFSVPSAHVATDRYQFDPPLIVRPGDYLTLEILGPVTTSGVVVGRLTTIPATNEFTIAGWWLLPGEAGN